LGLLILFDIKPYYAKVTLWMHSHGQAHPQASCNISLWLIS
jgi:hypothetical protein